MLFQRKSGIFMLIHFDYFVAIAIDLRWTSMIHMKIDRDTEQSGMIRRTRDSGL